MMTLHRAESNREQINHGIFIDQFTPDTMKLERHLERIYTKNYRPRIFTLFNEICISKEMLPKYTDTHTHTHTYIYIYICVCVCVCVCVCAHAHTDVRILIKCVISVYAILTNLNSLTYFIFL